MKFTVDIKDESADAFVIVSLKESRNRVYDEVYRLMSIEGELKPYQREDLRDSINIIAAINKVVQYYSAPGEDI